MERIAASDGCGLAVTATGPADARAVVLLHSIGCDHAMWDEQAQALGGRWRVIRPDARGHGASEAPAGDYALARLGRDVLEVMDALGVARASLCGLSLGGLVAQWVAAEAPDRVDRLVLANTAARIGAAEAWRDRAEVVRREGLAPIAEMALGRFFSEAFRDKRPDVVARVRARLVATPAQGYVGCCAALRDADLTPVLGRIAVPAMVIAGRGDVSTPPEQMARLAAGLARADYVVLDAAHLSNLEQPEAFTEILAHHLEAA